MSDKSRRITGQHERDYVLPLGPMAVSPVSLWDLKDFRPLSEVDKERIEEAALRLTPTDRERIQEKMNADVRAMGKELDRINQQS